MYLEPPFDVPAAGSAKPAGPAAKPASQLRFRPDRQHCRPVHQQAADWAAFAPRLRVRGWQAGGPTLVPRMPAGFSGPSRPLARRWHLCPIPALATTPSLARRWLLTDAWAGAWSQPQTRAQARGSCQSAAQSGPQSARERRTVPARSASKAARLRAARRGAASCPRPSPRRRAPASWSSMALSSSTLPPRLKTLTAGHASLGWTCPVAAGCPPWALTIRRPRTAPRTRSAAQRRGLRRGGRGRAFRRWSRCRACGSRLWTRCSTSCGLTWLLLLRHRLLQRRRCLSRGLL